MRQNTFKSSHFDLAVNTIDERDLQKLIDWLQGYPRLTMDAETRRFEELWSRWLGVKYSVMCNSGSSANLLMYAALETAGRARRKKVVVPATGWVTTITPAIQLGWQPLMCGSDAATFGLNLDQLETILKRERPDAVMLVHVLGVPNDMTRVLALQRRYGFEILEDCCASHGALHRGRKVGTFGSLASFSFYYGHHMATVEGGVVSTDDRRLYQHLLMLRSHGWLKDLPKTEARRTMRRYGFDPFHGPFLFLIPGYNLRPTDIGAKLGQIQLRRLDETIRRRVRNHRIYQQRLAGCVDFQRALPGDTISSISFCAVAESPQQRRRLVRALDRHKIDTRIFTAGNLGRHPFWTERYGRFSCPVADRLFDGGFFLPNNQALTPADVHFVCDVLTGKSATTRP